MSEPKIHSFLKFEEISGHLNISITDNQIGLYYKH